MSKKIFLILVLAALGLIAALAQTHETSYGFASISGRITNGASGDPLEFASIVLSPSKLYSVADANGQYRIEKIPAGKTSIKVEFFGMQEIDTTLTLGRGQSIILNFAMTETSFRLQDVTVTATRSDVGGSTASKISRQAMDHMQTSSLADVMSLLPGISITNPSLSSATSLAVRDNSGRSEVSGGIASLGTAVIVDGAPLSNNANMQMLTTAQSGSTTDGNTGAIGAAGGVDIRSLSTDNVESIEVIRGIPSAEYGDLTSGAVLVKSKAGRSPLTLRFKTNPNIYQVSAAKGLSLGKKKGDLNVSGDYAYNVNDLVKSNTFYQRANMKGLWSVRLGENADENTSLTLSYGRDRKKYNSDEPDVQESYSNDFGLAFNTNGHASINKGWLKGLNWLASGSYHDKHSYYSGQASNALNLYSTAMEDGMVYTNRMGQQVVDDSTGTNIVNAMNAKGTILPYNYDYAYDIYGKEINVFAKFNADFGKTIRNLTERFKLGADFKTDGNLGKGAVYDDEFPPFRNISNAASGYRRRKFKDIPFVTQVGAYAENYLTWQLGERTFNLSAGLRYDYVNGKDAFSPRMNASADIFPWLTVRGGYGVTSKAPTSIYLYPNNAYNDALNFNGMNVDLPENERLLIATTHVYNSENPDLEIAQNRKAELGLDLTIAEKYRLSVTAYDERMDNGYTMGRNLNSFKWYQHKIYDVVRENEGSIPTVALTDTYNLFFQVYTPTNNLRLRNKGIEYEIDLGRFDAIRTSFYLNGAYTLGESSNKGHSFSTRTSTTSNESHIGIYPKEKSKSFNESHITTLRVTHNIPEIGFVITLTAQAHWFMKYWTEYYNDTMFESYISYKDGNVHEFDPSKKDDPEFSYLFPTLSDNRFIKEKYKPYALLHLNLSKEIGDKITASFYVNNIFNNRPLYRMKNGGNKIELASDTPIYFGFELKVNIK